MKSVVVAICCAAMISAATGSAARAQEARDGPMLEVTGSGSVAAEPDMAIIRLGVEAREAGAAEAVSALSRDLGRVIEGLTDADIEPRDIQTGQLRLNPVYGEPSDTGPGRGEREITGYVAISTVSARVRELGTLGGVLRDAVNVGANRFDGLDFTMSNTEPAEDAALAAAVADAMRKGALMAEAAGVALGPILSISESGGGRNPRPMPMMDARMAMEESVPIQGGEVEITAQAVIRFALGTE